ncbi:MAG: hypothetical protein ACE5F1_18480 [Planctomycetota bacterium]
MMRVAPILLPLSLLASGCAGAAGPELAGELRALLGRDAFETLLAIDRLEARGDPAVGPYLLALQRDPEQPLDVRARAAAALLGLGYELGQSFCLGVLGASLPGSEERDEQLGLPRAERWAFARELAVRALEHRLRAAGVEPPHYDVNLGVPDMLKSVKEYAGALSRLPRPVPGMSRGALASCIPARAPEGWRGEDWELLRRLCLESY